MNKTIRFGIRKILAIVLSVCLAAALLCILPACDGEKVIDKLEIGKKPTKTEYNVGEEFSVAGGEITVTYTDGTTETLAMDAEGVTVSSVTIEVNDGETTSEKTVTVRYGGKNARFKITVSQLLYKFTFNYNYTGATNTEKSVEQNSVVDKPTDPTRTGFTFYKWYADAACTVEYDFESEVTGDTTVYAMWTDDTKTYYDVTFDYNYVGSPDGAVQKVESGEKAKKPADPERKGYAFGGWYSDAAATNEYNFTTATVGAATTVYAKWTRTSFEAQEFVFEVEDTNLRGKVGPGLSGTATATGMIQRDPGDLDASNGKFVGYQYRLGLTLDFFFVSDMAVEDAKIVLRLSAEMRDYTMGPDNYKIMVNGRSVTYSPIEFKNVPKASSDDTAKVNALKFADYVIMENVTLKEGKNAIILQTDNSNPLSGTTVESDAPLVDCLKITTKAMLTWDASQGLPAKNY